MASAVASPEWVPDAEARTCHACEVAFTVVLRRHHCRSCGHVFCGNCTRKRVALPSLGMSKPVRVCDQCVHASRFFHQDSLLRLDQLDEISERLGAEAPPAETEELPAPPQQPRTAEPVPHLHVVMLVVGSRGDVQPFVALGLGLQRAGHRVTLATHECFREFVTRFGLAFKPLAGDPKELMEIMVQNRLVSLGMLQGAQRHRAFIRALMESAWAACAPPDAPDALIANPPSFAGLHIAEKLCVPLHMMFTMPWSRTRAFRSPFTTSPSSAGADAGESSLNYMSWGTVERLIWTGMRDIVNNWRARDLRLKPITTYQGTGHRILHDMRVPFAYCFSEELLPRPHDWGPHIDITGFWFLDTGAQSQWEPEGDLAAFLDADGEEPPVFVGFGSIVVSDPDELTRTVLAAVAASGRRAIIQKGWAGMDVSELDVPEGVLFIGPAPHDKLFERVSCVVHHGGAGTTSAGLRCGKPTVVVSFFGDQFFWGSTVAAMGLGAMVPHAELTADKLRAAIDQVLAPEVLATVAEVGGRIRAEDGVARGVESFHRALPLQAMRCDVLPDSHVARVYCDTCRLKVCAEVDAVVHARGGVNAGHRRHAYKPIDWAVGRYHIGVLSNAGSAARKIGRALGLLSGSSNSRRDPLPPVEVGDELRERIERAYAGIVAGQRSSLLAGGGEGGGSESGGAALLELADLPDPEHPRAADVLDAALRVAAADLRDDTLSFVAELQALGAPEPVAREAADALLDTLALTNSARENAMAAVPVLWSVL